MLTVLDLFSGIGGFSLGLERAGMRTLAFCEIEPYCRAVLRKHWPNVPIFDDVKELRGAHIGSVDVICGGFPCQDISLAGKGQGIEGERSGLWREFARLIGEIQPRYALIENVPALRSRGLSRVLCDLAALGYDAEWHCIPASAIGAPHQRDRIWIIAYSGGEQYQGNSATFGWAIAPQLFEAYPNANRHAEYWRSGNVQMGRRGSKSAIEGSVYGKGTQWAVEPNLGRVAYGVPARVDRLKALGNAIVPQIAEIIGRAIIDFEQSKIELAA